jgi:hypothetical protein
MEINNYDDPGSLIAAILNNPKLKSRLLKYGSNLLCKRTKGIFARHLTSEDLLCNVITKLLSGKINWNKEKCPLMGFLYQRIRSEVSNLIKKERKFIPVPLQDLDFVSEDIDGNEIEGETAKELIIDPFEDALQDEPIDSVEFKNIASRCFSDSVEEFCVFDEMTKGHCPRKIASTLGLSESHVYNIKKRVVRILKSISPNQFKSNKQTSEVFPNLRGFSNNNNNKGELI